jgi:hypothetical protein
MLIDGAARLAVDITHQRQHSPMDNIEDDDFISLADVFCF